MNERAPLLNPVPVTHIENVDIFWSSKRDKIHYTHVKNYFVFLMLILRNILAMPSQLNPKMSM